jgi:hypothetical protein
MLRLVEAARIFDDVVLAPPPPPTSHVLDSVRKLHYILKTEKWRLFQSCHITIKIYNVESYKIFVFWSEKSEFPALEKYLSYFSNPGIEERPTIWVASWNFTRLKKYFIHK